MSRICLPEDFLNITRKKFKHIASISRPLTCWISLTKACDLHCKFCFDESTSQPVKDELNTKEVFKLLDNISEAGTRSVVFGGGEPTLRNDLLQIVRYAAREKNMFVALNTHGQLLSDKSYVKKLKDAGVSQIKISVDGLEKSHEWNRGAGTYSKCIQGLRNCVEEGISSVHWITTISSLNYDEALQMIQTSVQMGIDITMVQLLPMGRGKTLKDLLLTKKQVKNWQTLMVEQQNIHGVDRIVFEDRYQITEDKYAIKVAADPYQTGSFMDTPIGCITGICQYCVNASGKVIVGDVMMAPDLIIGDLREEKLSDMWKHSELANLLRDRDKLKGKCGKCEFRFVCGGCRRAAYSISGDIMGADPQCWYKPLLDR